MNGLVENLWLMFPVTLLLIAYVLGGKPSSLRTERQNHLEESKAKYFRKFEIGDQNVIERFIFKKRKEIKFSREIRTKVLSKTDGFCFYCNTSLNGDIFWQVDHIWPVRFGGIDDLSNLVPSCVTCNKNKWAYLPLIFFFIKWVNNVPFTKFEREFISIHKGISLEYLTKDSFYKRGCDWWHESSYVDFAHLILNSPGIKSLPEAERKPLISTAKQIFDEMELGRIGCPSRISFDTLIDKCNWFR